MVKRYKIIKEKVACICCGKMFEQNDLESWFNIICKQEPTCSRACYEKMYGDSR